LAAEPSGDAELWCSWLPPTIAISVKRVFDLAKSAGHELNLSFSLDPSWKDRA
jgi:hypothetical protein